MYDMGPPPQAPTITLSVILTEAVRILQNKAFARFARQAGIHNDALCRAIREAELGLIAAELGGGVIKQRIARPGQGKSSGFRVVIVFKAGALAIFVHGFAKNERDNIRHDELSALRRLASELLSYEDKELARAIASGTLMEIICDGQAIQ
jgi:hypothetical protein